MKHLLRVLDALSALTILSMALLVFVSVGFRYFLNAPILMAEDALTMLLGLAIFAAYAKITVHREHVSVDLLGAVFEMFPAVNKVRRLVIDVATLGLLGLVAWRLIVQAMKYHARGNFTPTMEWPLWPAVSVYAVLVSLAVLLFFIRLISEWSGRIAPPEAQDEDLF